MINEKGVLKVYEKILRHKKKVNISIESKRIAKIFDYNPKIVYDIIKKKATEEFKEEEHPRDDDGKFADKDGSNSRVERQKSILQQEIDYLKKSIKEESKKYRPFEKVSDEDREIRWVNKSVGAQIEELEEELNSSDTVGLPFIPLKPNTHKIETIDNGMYLANSDSEPEYESEREAMKSWSGMKLGLHPLEGFKKGNSTIKVSLDIKEKSDSGIHREVAEEQINLARIMWNSLSDEERDSIHNLTIEKRPSIKYVKNEKGEDVLDSASVHEASVVGSWAFADNELTIRIDPYLKPEVIKGTFIHEVGHSMYHKLQEKHPERIKKWKEMVEKIPPTTKYGKYNLKRWKDGAKQLNQMEKDNWEWQEVVQREPNDRNGVPKRDDDGNVVMVRQPIAKQDREIFRNNALSNVAFYKDLYFNEIHSEVHMYMMGQQKRGHMKKTGKATKGITKFVEPYRLLHDLPKMEEPLVVGEAEEDSPVMEVEDITESIGEVVIYLDENFERVLDEDEGEYEFVIELNDDMTIKRYSIRSMWEETATEEFKEEEHPREDDGKFTTKGSGSTSGQAILHKTTHDFLKKWLSDVSMSNTQIFGSIMGKGGLDITYISKNPDYDEDLPESDDNPKRYTIDSPINNTYKLAKVLGIGIKSKKSQKEWSDANNEFLKLIDTNPDLNKVFKEYKGEVDGQNKMLQKKYKESKVFYRGTSVDELDAIFGFGEGSYSDTEYDVNHISKWRSRYTFKSLSMNHDETLKMYNAGMMIHFNADTVRKAGRLMDYKAEPTQYLHADVDSSIEQDKIENVNTDNPVFLIDEEEVRIDNSKMEGVKIDKIDIYLRGGSRPDGSSSTFDVINKLVNRFGITNNLPKWYELNRMELLGKDQLLDGKKDDKNFERVFAKDPKGVKYVKSIIDRKTGKTYPEIPFKYDKDKLNDHMRNMRTEAKKDMASTVQKDLMENKLFRSKVGDVMVKW